MNGGVFDEINHMLVSKDVGALLDKCIGLNHYSSMMFGSGVEHTESASNLMSDAFLAYCESDEEIHITATHQFSSDKHLVVVGEMKRSTQVYNCIIHIELGDKNLVSYRDFISPKSEQ